MLFFVKKVFARDEFKKDYEHETILFWGIFHHLKVKSKFFFIPPSKVDILIYVRKVRASFA